MMEVWGAVGAVIAAVVAYLGVKYTADQANKAQEISAKKEEDAVDAAAYERARESYEAAITRYLAEIDRLSKRAEEVARQLADALDQIDVLRKDKRDQRYEIDATVEQLIDAKRALDMHLGECQRRVERLRRRLREADPNIRPDDPDLYD